MPELPDLQVFSSNLHKRLKGKVVQAVTVIGKAAVSSRALEEGIKGQKVQAVSRDGKELRIEFDNGRTVGMHLMLHGALHIAEDEKRPQHVVMDMRFIDETALVLTDWQHAAKVTLDPAPATAPDALSGEVNAAFLGKIMAAKRTAVKTMLMDQKIIRGIGNAYADEILWAARISPFSVCKKVPPEAVGRLAKAIHSVLKSAETQIRKQDPGRISGEVRNFLDIHNAAKKESPSGSTIKHKVAGGRKTYYTDEQELYE